MEIPKEYYPGIYSVGCQPIHPVHDWAYVRQLVRAAKRGKTIRPILIEGRPGNGRLLAGTHRTAANDVLALLGRKERIAVVSIDEIDNVSEELRAAVEEEDYSRIDELWDRP